MISGNNQSVSLCHRCSFQSGAQEVALDAFKPRERRSQERGGQWKGSRWLTNHEREALLESCEKSTWEGLYPLVLLALATGARQGELMCLTWDRVDLKEGTAYLESTKSGE